MTTQAQERLLNTREVAELLGVSVETVYHWTADGTLPSIRLTPRTLRFDPAAIAAFVERGAVATTQ
jgi:excisionase family DNA binding protein